MLYPLRNNLLVHAVDDPDEYRYGNLVLARPDSTKNRSDQGIVKAVGPEVKEVRVGDYVLFSPYSGTVVNVEGEGDKSIMLSEEGVVAVLDVTIEKMRGVYFKNQHGDFFEADYVSVIEVLRALWQDIPRVAETKKHFVGH